MRTFRILTVACLLILLTGATTQKVSAQTSAADERLETAQEMFSLMTKDALDQVMSQVMNKAWGPMEQKLRDDNVDAATIAELHDELSRIQTDYMRDMMSIFPELYSKYFTTREMKEIIAFNQSPTGQKAMREMPRLMGELMGIMMSKMPGLERQINETANEILRRRGL